MVWEIDVYQVGSRLPCSNKEYSVMLGSSTLHPNSPSWALKIPVGDIIMHPRYWGRNFIRSDVALLCLETPVAFNKYVQPICLPEHNFNLKVGTKCWVTGWGQVKPHPSGKLGGVGDTAPLGLYGPLPRGAFEEATAVVFPHVVLVVVVHTALQ